MRVATAAQIAELDRRAVEEHGVPAAVLMDHAGRRVAEVAGALLRERSGHRVLVLAGKGNNGGDGLVAARYLRVQGIEASVLLLGPPDELRGEAGEALKAAQEAAVPIRQMPDLGPGGAAAAINEADLIVDALFGTGFRGPVRGEAAVLIELANHAGRPIVAADIPSGLEADTGRWEGACTRAAATVTMALPKPGLLIYPGAEMTGRVYVADIGYPVHLYEDPSVPTHLVTAEMVRVLLPARRSDTHKGTYGRVLVVAGSVGFTGAAVLATRGALRTGSGLVTVAVPQTIYPIVAAAIIEGMPAPLPDAAGALASEALAKVEELAAAADVVAVGPGLGRGPGAGRVVEGLLAGQRPLVIDADGLNVLAGRTRPLEQPHAPAVLTPHPGELGRLTGNSVDAVQRDRLGAVRSAATRFRSVLVLKGARTLVAAPDGEAFIVPTGNPGMATGGMGDVLTGAVASLIGQGLKPVHAAYTAAYLHGLAADQIAHERGMVGMLASEVADYLPVAIRRVQTGEQKDTIIELRDQGSGTRDR